MNARALAVQALCRVETGGYANLVWNHAVQNCELDTRDRAFAAALFYGTLERQLTLDCCLDACLKKPVKTLDAPVRAILRSGLYQMRYLQTPPAAAVNEAVKLTRVFKKSSAAGLVNAVLRRAPQVKPEETSFAGQAERLSALYSVGLPVVRLLLGAYPVQTVESILAASFACPETTVRANPLQTTPQALAAALQEEGAQTEPGRLPGSLRVRFAGSPAASAAFARGDFHVQGEPSQLAVLCVDAQPGQKVLDLCAAPGGKSLTMAQQMQNKGQLFACEKAENRVTLIKKALARGGITCATVLCRDAAQHDPALEKADRVLCDVPCSGLGVLGKKPDIRYKTLDGLEQLCRLQAAILQNGASYLQRGGRLVYSTCTLNPDENERIVDAFLRQNPDFCLAAPPRAAQEAMQGEKMRLFLPGEDFSDGFFIATMERL